MKNSIILVLAFILSSVSSLSAQSSVGTDPFEVQMRTYKLALTNYDLSTATVALYNMLALKPERKDINDSLALLYFAGERYAQAYLVGEEIVKQNPARKDMLELVAVCKQNLGLLKESLADYEKLYASEKSLYYLYQMATLQYQLKRYGECVASLDQIIVNADAAKQKVTIRLQGGSQEVPMNAAALNVKGICALEMNQPEIAKSNFEKALELYPEFVLAQGNLSAMKETGTQPQEEKPQSAPPAKTSGKK